MKVLQGSSSLGRSPAPAVITIGNFDGVHLGHQLIFRGVIERASEIRGISLVYTFEPHPLRVLAPDKAPPLITTLKEKAEMIEAAGIDILVCEPFTKDFANRSPKSFIAETLWDHIHMKEVFVGHDYAFGKNREGTIELLTDMGPRLGFNVTVVDNIEVDHVPVRSTYIRDEILQGNVRRAGRLLGREYSLSGIVVRGARRKIGFPTANMNPHKDLIPKNGVYAVRVLVPGGTYAGVMNIGVNPTFKDASFTLEVHILDFNADIYDQEVSIYFVERLRDEKAYGKVEELVEQINADIKAARTILEEAPTG